MPAAHGHRRAHHRRLPFLLALGLAPAAASGCAASAIAADPATTPDPNRTPPPAVICEVPERLYLAVGDSHVRPSGFADLRARLDAAIQHVEQDCVRRAIAFLDETDPTTSDLWVSTGYAAAQPRAAFAKDGATVILSASRVCGGAYPASALTLIRVPRGARITHQLVGGECPRDVP